MMATRSALCIVLACVIAGACSNQHERGFREADQEFVINYQKYTLDNGLDVILHVDNSNPVVAVASLFHVGSNRERPGRTGFAHFFEHMSFNDSENVPRGANRKYIEELGGSRNGGTSFDYTEYYEIVPKDALEKIFWIDSDRMGYMINTVTNDALEREKEVVKNEKRQRIDNVPYGHTWTVILDSLFREGHPYSWPVIGSLQDLQNATLDDVKSFYDRWYGANNATLVVAGDFDPDVIKPQIERWFGEMRRGPEVEPSKPAPALLDETRNLWHPDNFARLPELTRVYPSVEQFHSDAAALEILAQILAGSKTAPLYQVIVEERKLAPSVYIHSDTFELAGMLTVGVRAFHGTHLDDVVLALEEGLLRFSRDGFSDIELTRVKTEIETTFYRNHSGVLNKARQLASFNEFAGDPGFATENLSRIKAVKREDVMRVFKRYVQDKPFLQTSFVPKDSADLAVSSAERANVVEETIVLGAEREVSQGEEAIYDKTPSMFDRSEPPLGTPPIVQLPEIWTRSTSNGIKVIGVEDHEVPLITFSLLLPGGRWLDLPDGAGASSLLAELLTQGTANRTPAELEEAIGLLGATIDFSAEQDSFRITAVTLTRNFEATVSLVEEMLLEPGWDKAEFERLKNATEASIIAAEGNVEAVADRAWNKLLFGDEHPYGRPALGTRESIAAVTIDDLKNWHAANVVPNGARLQVVGAIDGDRVVDAFASLAENWAGSPVILPEYKLPPPSSGQHVYFIDVPGAKQSVVRVGKRIMPVTDPEWLKLDFANLLLGGGASARLTQVLRIEKGYTYGAWSSLGDHKHGATLWSAETSVRSNVTLESMEIIRSLIANYGTTFTDEDASTIKNRVVKRNARDFETLNAKLRLLEKIAQYDYPHNVVEQDMITLEAMEVADFQETVGEHISEDEMIWLIVGDGATQQRKLEDFGYGKPVELDRDGAVLK